VPRAVAINVGANTTEPGFRGPIYPDGRFQFVPIPETEPTREPVPTYADLDLEGVPGYDPLAIGDQPVHLDPSFAEYPCCEAYTYGDPHPVKAGPIAELSPGDWLLFYATLSTAAERSPPDSADLELADWIAPDWGAYLIGAFRIEMLLAPEQDTGSAALSSADRERFRTNAHLRRADFDARVLGAGDTTDSRLFDRAVPLSSRGAGSDPNRLVTDLSADSGKGPWWRRPLRFDAAATATLTAIVDERRLEECFATE
jgi:hypothetical protein